MSGGDPTGEAAPRPESPSLLHGLAWTGVAKWTAQIASWAATLVTARLLTPHDYGLFGLASLYLGLLAMFSEFGLTSTAVNLRDLDNRQLSQLNGLALLLGAAGFGVTALLSRPMAIYFNAPALERMLPVLGIGSVLSALQVVPNALLQRGMNFRRLSIIDGAQSVTQSAMSVAGAALGLGAWSFVVGGIAGQTLAAACLVTSAPSRPRLPTRRGLGPSLAFSRDLLVSRLCWYAYANGDQFVVGRRLGTQALGGYNLALSLAEVPIDKVTALVGRVLPTYLAANQGNPAGIGRYLRATTEGVGLVAFPLALGLACVADDFVPAVLGAQWTAVVPTLRILACVAAVRAVLPLAVHVLLARGRSSAVVRNSVLSAVALPIAFLIGSSFGTAGVAWAWLVGYPIIAVPLLASALGEIAMPFIAYVRCLAPALLGSLAMALAVLIARSLLPVGWEHSARLVPQVVAGAVAYLATLGFLFLPRLRDLVAVLRGPREADATGIDA